MPLWQLAMRGKPANALKEPFGHAPSFQSIPWHMQGLSTAESEMAHLDRESSNTLFEALQEWEAHLAQTVLNDQRCADDTFAP